MIYADDFNHKAAMKSRKTIATITDAWSTSVPPPKRRAGSSLKENDGRSFAIVRFAGIAAPRNRDREREEVHRSLRQSHDGVSTVWRTIGVSGASTSGGNNGNSSDSDNDDGDAATTTTQPLWKHYCRHSTLHGFRYLVTAQLRVWQRLLWLILIGMAGAGILYVSLLVQRRYTANGLATIVESTVYPIAEIPYPAVMVCNYNRVNWKRVPAAIDALLPNGSAEAIQSLYTVLESLNRIEYGAFDSFNVMRDIPTDELVNISLSDLFRRVNHRCDEMFIEPCWWRNKYLNCCSIFYEQTSEYGICYSFNSQTNPVGLRRTATETNYPWRTANYGDWSGLWMRVRVSDDTRMPNLQTASGILVNVQHPAEWPNTARFVPSGTRTTITVKPQLSYVVKNVISVPISIRECLFPEDIIRLPDNTLPQLEYNRNNCASACRQLHMLQLCNCTMDILYTVTDTMHKCNISDLMCLNRYDEIFNYAKPPENNPFFSDEDGDGISCDCMTECDTLEYYVEITPITVGRRWTSFVNDESVMLDIHFQQNSMVKYRTALVFDWVDLLVSFGGIAGLFLGCSIISVAEATAYSVMAVIRLILAGRTKWATKK